MIGKINKTPILGIPRFEGDVDDPRGGVRWCQFSPNNIARMTVIFGLS
jgi:hypothetical protein